jgi:hypothetical protein
MYTNLIYEAERTRSPQEQRELNRINGEISLALRRPFRGLRGNRYPARAVPRQPRADGQRRLRAGAFPSEATAPQARCN